MSNTEVTTWSSSEQGMTVSGTTQFAMNISGGTDSRAMFTAGNYVIPDFSKTLKGTIILDDNAPVVELKKVPIEEAKRLVHQYLKDHPASRTSDLIIELALEPDIVLDALSQLRCEGKVEGRDVVHK